MEQNNRNRRSFSNEESFDKDQNRYNQSGYGNNLNFDSDYDNDWNRDRNYGNSGRSNYDQEYGGGYRNSRMNQDRNSDRWNDESNPNWASRNTYNNYGKTGSYSDWDFQNSGSRSRDFDSFSNDYNDRKWNRGSGSDYGHGGYGHGSSNLRQGNYEGRYGSQDYGRYSRSQDFGRNRDWDDDYRSGRYNRDNDRNWWDKTKDEVASWFGDDEAERRRRMDERREYNHRGRGPKNYSRSSERIKEDVNDRLSDAWDVDASDIEVSIDGNEITLTGTVPSKQQKRRAEDIAESVSGVSNVQNNLRVKQNQGNWNQGNDWGNSGSSNSGSSFSNTGSTTGATQAGSTNLGSTSGSSLGTSSKDTSSSTGLSGTSNSGTTSNQVKIEKSSAS